MNKKHLIPTKLLNVEEVADQIGCSERHIKRLVASDKFPAPIKIGRLSRWKQEHIDQWIEEGGAE